MRVTATRTVPQTPEQVWAVLADHEGMSHWAPGLKATLDREGTPEPNGVGAVRRIVTPGPAPVIVEEIEAFHPGRRLGYRALSGVPFRDYAGDVELRPVGAGTEIRYTMTAEQRLPVAEKVALTAVAHTLLALLVRRVRATS